jgi:hypothetical protein
MRTRTHIIKSTTLSMVVALLLLSPASTSLARASATKAMWGPYTHDGTSLFPTYRELGVKIYEDHLFWSTIAPRRPQHPTNPNDPAYVWPAEVTQAVAEAKRYGIQVALQIIGAPTWANGGKPWNWAPSNPQDYANFAIAAAKRYPSVHLWMIWGEPSRSSNFEPLDPVKSFARKLNVHQRSAPHRYARMLDAAYGALKSVSRSNIVIGGMTFTTGNISTQQWIENLRLPDGKSPRLDMYGHNPFSFVAPNLSNPPFGQQVDFSSLGRLSKLVDRYLGRPGNPDPKLFISEWTVPTKIDLEFNFYVEPLVQARWITDALRIAGSLPSIYAVGWIHLYDEPPTSYGGLLETDGAQKPGYAAWKAG